MNVLFLVARKYYEHKLSRCRFSYMQAVSRHPEVKNYRMWGVGLDGFHGNDLSENIPDLGWVPDVVVCYKQQDHTGLQGFRKAVLMNECWPHRPGAALEECQGMALVVCHHENDLPVFGGFQGRVVHIPHSADPHVFYPVSERPTECLLSGVLSGEIYPLRERFKNLLLSGHIRGRIRPHMGGPQFHSRRTSYRSDTLEQCERQWRDYAEDLRRSKLSLCCTSKYKYALEKLVQSAMSGCLVASDMPDDSFFRNTIGRHILEIDPAWSDAQINRCLNDALSDPDSMQERASAGRDVALRELSTVRYAERFVEAVKSCL